MFGKTTIFCGLSFSRPDCAGYRDYSCGNNTQLDKYGCKTFFKIIILATVLKKNFIIQAAIAKSCMYFKQYYCGIGETVTGMSPLKIDKLQRRCSVTKAAAFALALLFIAACQSSGNVPVEEFAQPPSEKISTHRVSAGETLYSIAWRYNFDTDTFAKLNGIGRPYRIKPGQRLALDQKTASRMGIKPSSVLARAKEKVDGISARASQKRESKPVQTTNMALGKWVWPTRGKLLDKFSRSSTRKGVGIAGEKGQSIVAANDGQVVYAGDGLPALGKLLIVRHDGDYLSAYAHNDRLLVANGQKVNGGQKIAELGNSGTGTKIDQLHFEIRYKGRAVNPLAILPKAG